jgi:hypothetical protein
MFTVAGLNAELIKDNPTFERILRSDLHDLVVMLRRMPPNYTLQQVAAEMKKVSRDKWVKYTRTRQYLERELIGLTALLRAIPTDFKTTAMTSQMGDTILRHTFTWKSDTGSLQDLAQAVTREHVRWPQWPPAITAFINPAFGAAYMTPGSHHGLANANPASSGSGQDDHGLFGPFNQTIIDYRGPLIQAPMDQTYQYSHDRVNWQDIPGSSFTIVRSAEGAAGGKVKLSLTKTRVGKPSETFTVSKIL